MTRKYFKDLVFSFSPFYTRSHHLTMYSSLHDLCVGYFSEYCRRGHGVARIVLWLGPSFGSHLSRLDILRSSQRVRD